MIEFLSAFIGVFLITTLLTPICSRIGLVDKPDKRKSHNDDVPLIGGLAMFASCSLAALFFVPHSSEMTYLLAACGLLVMTGSIDDRFNLHYYIRLVIQALAAIMLIWGAQNKLVSFGYVYGIGELTLGWLAIPITIIGIIGIINAYNMIDGIDGLSGGITLISVIGLYLLITDSIADGANSILLLLIGALAAYLIMNLHFLPKWTPKIFMGDAGSMVLGFIMASFLIRYSQGTKQIIMPVTALWLTAVPLMDIFVTTIRRIRHKRNPLHPDRTHVHYIFMRAGFKQETTLLIILTFQTIAVACGLALEVYGSSTLSFFAFGLLFLVYLQFISHAFKVARFIRRYKKRKATTREDS
ncbi:undecaprenyl-phosphate alpha-N-acetylglucosaminyl 1-phosphate transferase [Reinekea marinisedimentorum]|uniref:UDP-GlcNAc:undecaprenyl-phosphate GlcNAc-1-phosphate transferase n=1 Tax=Reinekea marinisedimentorum TaxID=230495 RepID=A0A4R3IBP9_9GAMM|nr:undecaprenyl-phosphate alpha-N-acetylglucosaminyl 1-phosphate transferase [Reinekea marinisedimentorum]TCS41928.1 UDP-GlcNAc:undecaprenyl-phosphate GlcNAc-1-phosphate transferase [Reinekea marinisedimentorum]